MNAYNTLKNHLADYFGPDELKENLESVTYNITGGVFGFVYYTETLELFEKFKAQLLDICYQIEHDCGVSLKMDFSSYEQFIYRIVWIAFEEVARRMLAEMGWSHE